jgi:hypothetical protein
MGRDGVTIDTERDYDQLYHLAKRMVDLERLAKHAEARYEQERADRLWADRELVQWQRSLLLRDVWDARRGTEQQRGT